MKIFALSALALMTAAGSAAAADYSATNYVKAPLSVEIVAPAAPAAPPVAVVSQKLTVYELLSDGWQPVKAALVPVSGVPGTGGQLAHTDAAVLMLYKQGAYVYCAEAQVGGAYNNCHVAGPGNR